MDFFDRKSFLPLLDNLKKNTTIFMLFVGNENIIIRMNFGQKIVSISFIFIFHFTVFEGLPAGHFFGEWGCGPDFLTILPLNFIESRAPIWFISCSTVFTCLAARVLF